MGLSEVLKDHYTQLGAMEGCALKWRGECLKLEAEIARLAKIIISLGGTV